MRRPFPLLASTLAGMLFATSVAAQFAYPSQGQSPQQQANDEAECGRWAAAKTGFDPLKSTPLPAAVPAPVTGSGARVAGAAAGAGVGAVSGGNVGEAALAGAVVGGVARRVRNQQSAAAQNEAARQQRLAAEAGYQQARSACLTGRGYTVR